MAAVAALVAGVVDSVAAAYRSAGSPIDFVRRTSGGRFGLIKLDASLSKTLLVFVCVDDSAYKEVMCLRCPNL